MVAEEGRQEEVPKTTSVGDIAKEGVADVKAHEELRTEAPRWCPTTTTRSWWTTEASPLAPVDAGRPEEVDADELRADDPDLARFQPVGLIRSKCFTVSQKMTCTTCHDPHRPLEAQDSLGDWQCIQCHDPAESSDTLCKAGQPENCLQCHMPKVQSTDPLRFTDHWIRVR